jgi:hypothetical protein
MPQEISYWFIASLVVAGFWSAGRLIAQINRRLNSRRVQRGIAEYLLHKTAGEIITQ